MCHAMPFSIRALKKNIFFDVDIVVKKQIEIWFIVVCTLTDHEYVSLLVSQTFFFVLFLHIKRVVRICIMQHVHFQVRVGVFSCQDKYLFYYLRFCGKKQMECGVCTLIDNDTRQHSGQNVVHLVSPQQIELHQKARALLSTSAAYTHRQIVDAELANQSARFALVML